MFDGYSWKIFFKKNLGSVFILFFIYGCTTVSSHNEKTSLRSSSETNKDALSAAQTMANSLSGKNLTDQQIKELSRDIQKNKDTQTAIQSITRAVSSNRVKVHYCPVDGERFSFQVKVCPQHHVLLKEVEE